jgi:hypothetical protein
MRLLLATLCTACLMTAACDGDSVRISTTKTDSSSKGVLKVVDALQCPETLGVLTRKGSAHSGGTTCLYSGPRGAEVALQLISLADRTPDAVLQRIEADLTADMPHTTAVLREAGKAAEAEIATETAKAEAAQAGTEAAEPPVDAGAKDQATVRAPGMAIDAQGDRARVRLPGMSIDAQGDKASVRIGGFSISADDSNQSVDVRSSDESVSVQAHDDAAEIRTRAPGDATRRTYILTDRRPADQGWRLVGYEARGPVGGPIVIATVRAKDRDSDGVFDSAKDLVTLNVGE